MVAGLRRLDAFVKTRPDLQQKSTVGGIITLVATTTTALLFIGQLAVYIMGRPHHALRLSKSVSIPLLPIPREHSPILQHVYERAGKIPLKLHVTFPHLSCDQLDVIHDGASMISGELEKVHGKHSLTLRTPTASELKKVGITSAGHGKKGCTVEGSLRPQIVAGVLQITISRKAWAEATSIIHAMRDVDLDRVQVQLQNYNVSHYIHKVEFGKTFQRSAVKPLKDRPHIINNDFGGIAVEQVQVKLVPTTSNGFLFQENSYQTSVADHTIQPQTLVSYGVQYLPGLVMSYDFTPLSVVHTEGRDNILVFLSSLVSIVGGVFVTVGLLTSCLVHSATAVAKKID